MWLATIHLRFQKPSSSLIPCIEQVAQSDVGGYCAHQIAHWELLSRVQQVNDDLPSSDLMYAVTLRGSWEGAVSSTAEENAEASLNEGQGQSGSPYLWGR